MQRHLPQHSSDLHVAELYTVRTNSKLVDDEIKAEQRSAMNIAQSDTVQKKLQLVDDKIKAEDKDDKL